MAALNLRGEPLPSADPPPPEEPLGLDLIRGWLAKPRPRLYRLWLWVPLTAEGVRRAHRWLRANAGPALRRTARTLRRVAAVTDALRRIADRIGGWLQAAFPPGSRGREMAGHMAGGSRLLGRSVLVLLGISREADRIPRVFENERRPHERPDEPERPPELERPPPEPERPPPEPAPNPPAPKPAPERSPSGAQSDPAPEPPRRPAPEDPGASSGAGPPGPGEPAASRGPSQRDDSPASDGPARSRTSEDSRPGRSPKEPSQPEPSGEDQPGRGSPGPAPADPSPVLGVPPGPRADALARLSKNLRAEILMLGKRPRKSALRYTVWWILNECGETTSETLGLLLQVDPANLAKRHLSPLVDEGALERTIPDRITHPDQAYRATRWPPGAADAPVRQP